MMSWLQLIFSKEINSYLMKPNGDTHRSMAVSKISNLLLCLVLIEGLSGNVDTPVLQTKLIPVNIKMNIERIYP